MHQRVNEANTSKKFTLWGQIMDGEVLLLMVSLSNKMLIFSYG